MPRVPIDATKIADDRISIGGGDARHLATVLRLKAGDAVTAFDGQGREWDATIASVGPARVELALGAERNVSRESPCRILLGQGVGKGEKLELVLRAATELGANAVAPVLTARAVASAQGPNRLDRWRRIAAEACKQCGRSVVPDIHPPESLEAFLIRAREYELKVVPWEGAAGPSSPRDQNATDGTTGLLRLSASKRPASAAVLIGPEGGLTSGEIDVARAAGFEPVSLGPRILRTETAGIASVAALQLLFGDLG